MDGKSDIWQLRDKVMEGWTLTFHARCCCCCCYCCCRITDAITLTLRPNSDGNTSRDPNFIHRAPCIPMTIIHQSPPILLLHNPFPIRVSRQLDSILARRQRPIRLVSADRAYDWIDLTAAAQHDRNCRRWSICDWWTTWRRRTWRRQWSSIRCVYEVFVSDFEDGEESEYWCYSDPRIWFHGKWVSDARERLYTLLDLLPARERRNREGGSQRPNRKSGNCNMIATMWVGRAWGKVREWWGRWLGRQGSRKVHARRGPLECRQCSLDDFVSSSVQWMRPGGRAVGMRTKNMAFGCPGVSSLIHSIVNAYFEIYQCAYRTHRTHLGSRSWVGKHLRDQIRTCGWWAWSAYPTAIPFQRRHTCQFVFAKKINKWAHIQKHDIPKQE